MTDKPPPDPDQLSEAESAERFKRIVGNLATTPYKPQRVNDVSASRKSRRAT